MNRYPLWKNLLVIAVVLIGLLYALPNYYGSDPALQISGKRGSQIDDVLETTVAAALADAGFAAQSIERQPERLLVRFADTQTQLKARDAVDERLEGRYVVALNLAPATPTWLGQLGAEPMYLGLDLRGGVHFLMEVDMVAVKRQAEERFVADIKTALRSDKIRYLPFGRGEGGPIKVRFRDTVTRDQGLDLIDDEFPEVDATVVASPGEFALNVIIKPEALDEIRRFALQQNITTLRNRVNELGVAEPIIQQQGQDRVVVQLPGVQDTARAKEILGTTATLEFRMVDTDNDVQDALDGKVPIRSKLSQERNGNPVLLSKDIMLTGEYIIDARAGIDTQTGSPDVTITLDGKGARIFSKATREQVGRPMAVVFIQSQSSTPDRARKSARVRKSARARKSARSRAPNEEVINIATIREQLAKRFHITGLDSTQEARDLALLLRAGALAAPIEIVEERTIGPSLGQENIDRGFRSVQIGFVLVLIFMLVYYRTFGFVADLALTLNLVVLVALLSMFQATLTLPGIAGIVLTVGMAVDANVLVFERIREEVRNGNSPQASIHAGYERAFSTIADANITTLIAAIVLFSFGTGPIKGFAVTLALGIITSMFTAIMGTRAVVNFVFGGRRLNKLSI